MSLDVKAIREILDTIEDEHLARLSMWERGFYETVKDTFEREGRISEGQNMKLEEIWTSLP